MTEYLIREFMHLTPAEELLNKQMCAMREVVRAAHARKPATESASRPASLQGSIVMTELEVWARSGKLFVVKQALLDGAEVNATDAAGMTALHYAVLSAEIRVVQLLLLAGADVQAKSASGQTPIDLAAAAKENALVRLMKDEFRICLKCDQSIMPGQACNCRYPNQNCG